MLKETGCECLDWIYLTENTAQLRNFFDTRMNFRAPHTAFNSLINWATVSFWSAVYSMETVTFRLVRINTQLFSASGDEHIYHYLILLVLCPVAYSSVSQNTPVEINLPFHFATQVQQKSIKLVHSGSRELLWYQEPFSLKQSYIVMNNEYILLITSLLAI
jgi:hypothetical protein